MADDILALSGIYAIKNVINNKSYIGSAVCFKNRFKTHKSLLKRNAHHSIKLQRAWNKYGEDSFEFSILEIVEDKEHLLSREQHYLDLTDSAKSKGYNICLKAGSMLGMKQSAETKAKISAASKGKPRPNNILVFSGKKLSKEHIAKVVAFHKGRKRSDETKQKISNAMLGHKKWLGKKHTQAAKDKISLANKGRPREKGIKRPQYVIDKMVEVAKKWCKQVMIDGIVYPSYTYAAKELKCDKSTIGNMVKDGRATLVNNLY